MSLLEKVKKFLVEARKAVVTAVGLASSLSVAIGVESTAGHWLAVGLGVATSILHYWTPNGIYVPTTPAGAENAGPANG